MTWLLELAAFIISVTMSAPPRKRTRTGDYVFTSSAKRPIDKGLIVVAQIASTTQQETTLLTATFPGTVTGIRWSLAFNAGAVQGNNGFWAIIIVRDGLAASSLSLTDGASLYEPEQDVLAYGVWRGADNDAGTGPAVWQSEGSTKSMRKLMGGDKLLFITKAAAITGEVDGCVQLFMKS